MVQRHPQAIDTSRLEQMQMLSDFLEMHFPTPQAKANLAFRRSYLSGLPDIDLSSAPMLRHAIEAICYAHAGSNYDDNRLIQQSQKSYGKVLASLVRMLETHGNQSDPRVIVPVSCCYAFMTTLFHLRANNSVGGQRITGECTTT